MVVFTMLVIERNHTPNRAIALVIQINFALLVKNICS